MCDSILHTLVNYIVLAPRSGRQLTQRRAGMRSFIYPQLGSVGGGGAPLNTTPHAKHVQRRAYWFEPFVVSSRCKHIGGVGAAGFGFGAARSGFGFGASGFGFGAAAACHGEYAKSWFWSSCGSMAKRLPKTIMKAIA